MSASAVRAGKAEVEVGIRDNIQKGLDKAAARLRSFGTTAAKLGAMTAGLGTAVLAPLAAVTAKFLGHGDALSKLSDKTGVSVEALGELTYAAQQSGASAADLEGAFSSMSKVMLKGDEESKKTLATLERLGVNMATLETQTPEARFNTLADAIGNVTDPTERAALASRVFGEAGQALLPMLKDGTAGMDALRQRARDLGLVMSGEDAAAATTLGDRWADIISLASRLGDIIGGSLAPVLIPFAETFIRIASAAVKWLDANRPLIVTIAKVAAAVVGIGTVITGVATAALGLSFVFSGISAAVAGFGAAGSAIAGIFAAIVSPVGLVIVGIATATAAFFVFTNAGQQLWATMKNTLGDLWDWTQEVFGGIYDAVTAGDLGLAGEIAMAALSQAWNQGLASLMANWGKYIQAVVQTFAGAMQGIAKLWVQTQGGISKGILSLAQGEGVVGDVMAKLLGVDLRKEQAKRDAMDNALSPVKRRNLEYAIGETEKSLATATDPAEIAKLQAALVQFRKELGQGVGGQSVIDEATGAIDSQTAANVAAIEQTVGGALAAFDNYTAGAQARADAAGQDLREKTTRAREQAAAPPATDLKKALDDAGLLNPRQDIQPPKLPDVQAGLQRASSLPTLATSSSYAVAAMFSGLGRGRKPEEETAANTKKAADHLQRLNEKVDLKPGLAFA